MEPFALPKRRRLMQFAVIARALDSSSIPVPVQLTLVQKTFELLKSRSDPRIKEIYGFAGERAGILIVEASSGEELQDVLSGLPYIPLVKTEIHPVASIDAALKTVTQLAERFTQLTPAGVG
jgi:muconolactone delta-isomerase